MALPPILLGLALIIPNAALAADSTKPAGPAPAPHVAAPTVIDPRTGLPLPPPPPWMDPSWPDPDRILAEVVYDQLPLGEVAHRLRKEFRDAFDVLVPSGWQDDLGHSIEPESISVKLQLKNVRASEVFNAMNLMFEAENTPCRWELVLNGNRPTAILRMLQERMPVVSPSPPPPTNLRMVYFVGDLVGDEKSGGPTMEQLVKTVSEVYQMSYGPSKSVLQFHQQAQLLVVNGTVDQIQFVQNTLSALREKPRTERKSQTKIADPKAATEETKPR